MNRLATAQLSDHRELGCDAMCIARLGTYGSVPYAYFTALVVLFFPVAVIRDC